MFALFRTLLSSFDVTNQQWYFAQTKLMYFCQLLIAMLMFKIEFRGGNERMSYSHSAETSVLPFFNVMPSALVEMFCDVSE